MTDSTVTYASYLQIDQLLSLQHPRSGGHGSDEDQPAEHDEMLFIVIHQVYELWFKQILWELDHVVDLLGADDGTRAAHTLHRVLRILKVMVGQLDVLETMTPLEFGSFRNRLDTASGFQSVQFREFEVLAGMADESSLAALLADGSTAAAQRLEVRLARPRLWPALIEYLRRRRHAEPHDDAAIQAMLVDVYRTDPAAAELCERFVDLDEGQQEWRYRHLRMVQRTIGTRGGTGGSDGAEYLATTIRQAFPPLWAIRTQL